jgi:hypothetical protein
MSAAAAPRPREATYVIHESHDLPTDDHEDHTFCGMMFDVEAKVPAGPRIPVDYLEINAVAVRGHLGDLGVYTTPETYLRKHEDPALWTKCYEGHQAPSQREYRTLPLQTPIVLRAGERCGLYVHSRDQGDEAIVYDDQRAGSREDAYIKVHPGQAHLSNKPFGRRGPWGTGWRANREFVGKISYGVKWLLWNPEAHHRFPAEFQRTVLLMLWAIDQPESSIAALPSEVVMYALNMCRWDWSPLAAPLPVFTRTPSAPRAPGGWSWGRFLLHGGAAMGVDDDEDEEEYDEDAEEDDEGDEDFVDADGSETRDGTEGYLPMAVDRSARSSGAADGAAAMSEGTHGADTDAGSDAPGLHPWEAAVRHLVCRRWAPGEDDADALGSGDEDVGDGDLCGEDDECDGGCSLGSEF